MTKAVNRRGFFRIGGRLAGALAVGGVLLARTRSAVARVVTGRGTVDAASAGQRAILFDATLCVGCRSCELACAEANALGRESDGVFEGRPWEDARALAPDVFTYVTSHRMGLNGSSVAFGRVQCMHCLEPACASSCPVSALEKTPEGPVIWHADRCLGCRYCMMACPYRVPRFEWDARNPRIRKCEMCHDRETPACVQACPTGALTVGTRQAMIEEAYRRIGEQPLRCIHHVYGETEAGGANLLHLSAVPFGELGYRTDLPECAYCDFTAPVMETIPYVINGLGLALGTVALVVRGRTRDAVGEEEREGV